jgi:nitrate/TMAO reductase-like tetraheme cytochrome c subunit
MLRVLLGAGFVAALSAPVGWVVTDRLERDNDFCNACHLTPTRPLHEAVRRDFDARPPASLAGLHGAARLDDRGGRAFRCIDCHGGVSFVGRARVKLLAGLDAFWYVTGHFEEPEGMAWPLWDEDCRQCHARFDESPAESWQSPRFHQLPVHNVELGVDCVECHLVHEAGGAPEHDFLHASRVRTQCARCHSEFEEEPR